MRSYNLGFISDENLFRHVKDTVEKYRFSIDLKKFNKNLNILASKETIKNSVFDELQAISPNLLKSLYMLSFGHYDGFDNLNIG